MDEKSLLYILGASGLFGLIGKIVYDWLKNRNKDLLTVETVKGIIKDAIIDLKEDIKKDFENLILKIENKYVPWEKYDTLKEKVDLLTQDLEIMKSEHKKNHGG
jgi:hypothetical protein